MITPQSIITLNLATQMHLKELGIMALYFFGSRAYGLANAESDFDFGILVQNPQLVALNTFELYEKIYPILSDLIQPETLAADVIDIVFLDSPRVPLELKFHIISHGQVIFDLDPQQRTTREERLMIQHADFTPLRLEMSQALLARL